MADKGKRLELAISELLSATQSVYGKEVVVSIGFDVALKANSRSDISDTNIDDILGDEDNIGNQ